MIPVVSVKKTSSVGINGSFNAASVATTLNKRGKVLIPVFALGRTQELLLLLDEYWESHSQMKRLGSIVYLNTLAKKSMILFKESINMMNNSIRNAISDRNPFDFRNVTIPDKVDEWLAGDLGKQPPCVILCSPAMMENGTSRAVLEKLAPGENNLVILTGYCMVVGEPRESHVGHHRASSPRERDGNPRGKRPAGRNGQSELWRKNDQFQRPFGL